MDISIVTGKYETGTNEQKQTMINIFGEENIKEKFNLYFHWFNIIHELGHTLLLHQGLNAGGVDAELFVNKLAVEYWRFMGDNNNFKKIHDMVYDNCSRLRNPVPIDEGFVDYFKRMWDTDEMNSSYEMYGIFQNLCVLEAFNSTQSLSSLLKEIGVTNLDFSRFKKYQYIPMTDNTLDIVNNFKDNFLTIQIDLTDVKLLIVDNPETQCVRIE